MAAAAAAVAAAAVAAVAAAAAAAIADWRALSVLCACVRLRNGCGMATGSIERF